MWSLLAALYIIIFYIGCSNSVTAPDYGKRVDDESIVGKWTGHYADTLSWGRMTITVKKDSVSDWRFHGAFEIEDHFFGKSTTGSFLMVSDNLYIMQANATRRDSNGEIYRATYEIYFRHDREHWSLRGIYDVVFNGLAVENITRRTKGRVELYCEK